MKPILHLFDPATNVYSVAAAVERPAKRFVITDCSAPAIALLFLIKSLGGGGVA